MINIRIISNILKLAERTKRGRSRMKTILWSLLFVFIYFGVSEGNKNSVNEIMRNNIEYRNLYAGSISRDCLHCICEAETGCTNPGCVLMPDGQTEACGYYLIEESYYIVIWKYLLKLHYPMYISYHLGLRSTGKTAGRHH